MPVPTKDPGDEVVSADHNFLAGLLNGSSDDYGVPVNLYRYNSSGGFSQTTGNQDTTNGLIQLWQYGTVGSATEVGRVTKAGVLAKMRDRGGMVFSLDAYAGGATINTATGTETSGTLYAATDAAWTAAFAAVAGAGGGTIQLGQGDYLAPQAGLTWPNNMTIRGAGRGITTILHRVGNSTLSQTEPIRAIGCHHFTLCHLTVDGMAPEIAAFGSVGSSLPFGYGASGEITIEAQFVPLTASTFQVIGGYENTIYDVEVRNFHNHGIWCGGQRNAVVNNHINGQALTSYVAWGGPPATNYNAGGSLYGIAGTGQTEAVDVLIEGNVVHGLRYPGIFVGGRRATIVNNRVFDCHRDLDASGSGGGVIALGPAWDGVHVVATGPSSCYPDIGAVTSPGYLLPVDAVIADNVIGGRHVAVTDGTSGLVVYRPDYGSPGGAPTSGQSQDNGGIEINQPESVLISNNRISGIAGIGIHISCTGGAGTSNIVVSGGIISKCWRYNVQGAPATSFSGAITITTSAGNATGLRIDNVTIARCSNAIYTEGTLAAISMDGVTIRDCTYGLTQTAAPASMNFGPGNQVYDSSGIGTYTTKPLPFRAYRSSGATGSLTAQEEWAALLVNASAAGNGLWVQGGFSSTHPGLRLQDYTGTQLLDIWGNGQIVSTSSLAAGYGATIANAGASSKGLKVTSVTQALSLNTTDTGASVRILETYQENGTDKVGLGLDASDNFAIYDADLTTRLLKVAPTTGALTATGTVFPSGQATVGFQGANASVADSGGTTTIGTNVGGWLMLSDPVGGGVLVTVCKYGSGVHGTPIINVGTDFDGSGTDTGSVWAVYRDGGTGVYTIKNKRGSGGARTVRWAFIGG